MRTRSLVISVLVAITLCVGTISCRKDNPSTPADPGNTDDPTNTEIPDNPPTDCIDPENTVIVNLRNDGGSVTILDCPLRINYANNFECYYDDYTTIASVGEVSGLGCIESIPQSGWSNQVAAIPGNGYVFKYERYHESTGSTTTKYARIYVVRYLFSATNDGILGAEIKYQDNWSNWLGTPVVNTSIVTEITTTTAICGGNVTGDGGYSVTERGICWSTYEEPTISDNHATSETGLGNYSIQMTNLTQGTRYYVRAYARNEIGISYGEQKSFKTQIGGIDYTNIVLNELNGDTKFIEIYNKGNFDLSMEGMYLTKDGVEDDIKWTGDATIVIPAHGYVVLYSIDTQADHPEMAENMFFYSGLSAKKSVRIALHMPNGTVRDVFMRESSAAPGEWGVSMSNVSPQSFARTPNGGDWKLADPTPGTANPATGEDIPQE